jgi:DNA-binding MarR family transcriptional regulator
MQEAAGPSEPGEAVVDAVLSASRVLVAVAARSLGDVAEEVTLTQYRTLVVLASRGAQNLAGLAEAIGVAPSTATRMCDRLVRKELIRRSEEDGDRRQLRVVLTQRGRSLVDAVSDARRQEIRSILSAVTPEEQTVLVEALGRFAAAAGEVPEQAWTSGWDL